MVRLLWHPRRENRFVVGGGSQIALYELVSDYPQIRQVTAQNDLQFMKCFSWSPHPIDDLFAVGLSTGKVDLIRLEAAKLAHRENALSIGRPIISLPQRNSRSCNALSFCASDLKTLAVGLDKVRGDCSLVLWDISSAIPYQNISTPSYLSDNVDTSLSRPSPRIPRVETGYRPDTRVLQQHAPAEVVSAISFLPNSTSLLLAGTSHRWLRLFDLRSQAPASAQAAAKVHGIATDLFDNHRVACFGDNMATIWDMRKFVQPLVTFSEKDALADGARVKPGAAYTEIEFSSTRRGKVVTLEKDGGYVRFWDILQSTPPSSVEQTGKAEEPPRNVEPIPGLSSKKSWANLAWMPGYATNIADSLQQDIDIGSVALCGTHRTRYFSPSLASFALVPGAESHPLTSNVMVVNYAGDLELYAVHDTPKQMNWSARGEFLVGAGRTLETFHLKQDHAHLSASMEAASSHKYNRDAITDVYLGRGASDKALVSQDDESGQTGHSSDIRPRISRQTSKYRKDRTHSPSSSIRQHQRGNDDSSEVDKLHQDTINGHSSRSYSMQDHPRQHEKSSSRSQLHSDSKALRHVMEDDMLMVMYRRTLQGYSLIKHDSATILGEMGSEEESQRMLPDLWDWITNARDLLSYQIDGYDFSFQGVGGIWEGFAPQERSKDSSSATPAEPLPNSGRSSRRQRASGTADDEKNFQSALQSLIIRREGHRLNWKASVPTSRLLQRQVALQLCGWSFREEDMANAIARWIKEGKVSRAVCWLVFTKKYNEAIDHLVRSKDESHSILSGTLAALIPHGSTTSARNNELRAHCERLSVRLQDPYFRAILIHLSHGDWTDVLEEESLPFRERLAIALQFLEDKALTSYLKRCVDRGYHIDRLIVTGLTPAGIDVLRGYVDHTSDVQTAAILSSFVCPTKFTDPRAERWLDAYRDLLDGFKLFSHRVNFDVQRGQIIQTVMKKNNVVVPAWVPPPQILIRCNYCSKFIGATNPESKTTACPHCNRDLPRCAICLLALGVVHDAAREVQLTNTSPKDTIDDAIVICQTCRHGGHASHILDWFMAEDGSRLHDTCPVADCECTCADEF